MSRNLSNRKKKSTSKYHQFKISPLIPVIAVIEVLVIIAVSSYAWFMFRSDKSLNTGEISVDADSGLDIDFQYADITDTINIWNYIGDDFSFEPCTSIDGRNLYFPTSGTFGSDETDGITFRDATINDINTKYINIDFELTNTSTTDDMEVYLNNNSYFYVKDKATGNRVDSKALRLAFYTNDASSGNVRSGLLDQSIASAAASTESNKVTIYFDNSSSNFGTPYAYVYGDGDIKPLEWPGVQMNYMGASIYSYTFDNIYNKVVFSDNGSNKAPADGGYDVYNGDIYTTSGRGSTFASRYNTIYFIKPADWGDCYAHLWDNKGTSTGTDDVPYHSYPGTQMTEVGANIYAFTYYTGNSSFNNNNNYILFNDGSGHKSNDTKLPNAGTPRRNLLYYFPSNGASGALSYTTYVAGNKTLYFYNSLGWSMPYAHVAIPDGNTGNTLAYSDVAMSSLSSNMYFCTVPGNYSSIYFYNKDDSSKQTVVKSGNGMKDGFIYRPTGEQDNNQKYLMEDFSYREYSDVTSTSYAVISPGVSAGFQRSYNPVVGISSIGVPNRIVPAFSDSIDNYIYGSGKTLFTLKAQECKQLSMIIWLEGTDEDCDNDYQDQQIDLRLEFSTYNTNTGTTVNVDTSGYYTYRFIDATREVWTSDRQTTESGLTVAPVMQLYDKTVGRGYLMHGVATREYSGKKKTSAWECSAPMSLVSDWADGSPHKLEFRRVNPYDEDEVWNFWDAGNIISGSQANPTTISEAVSNENGKTVISFTAFADGAPASDGEHRMQAGVDAGSPARSCGGLWGTFTTTTMYMLDGMHSQWFKNDNAVMTVHYKYKYPTSSVTSEIEYRASSSYGCIYYFVVPSDVIGSTTRVSAFTDGYYYHFKRYYDFDKDYAFNSVEKNSDLKNDRNILKITGAAQNVACFNEEFITSNNPKENSDHNANHYWGDRLVFFRISHHSTQQHANIMASNAYFKMFFKKASDSGDSDTKTFYLYTYHYDSSNTYKTHNIYSDEEFETFVTAMPKVNGNAYKYLDVERVDSWNDGHWSWSKETLNLNTNNLVYIDRYDDGKMNMTANSTNDYL